MSGSGMEYQPHSPFQRPADWCPPWEAAVKAQVIGSLPLILEPLTEFWAPVSARDVWGIWKANQRMGDTVSAFQVNKI